MGGAGGVGFGAYFFDFRSKGANCHAHFVFAAAGIGFGGSLGSGSGPSPADVVYNRLPNLFTPLKCLCRFCCDNLDWSSGTLVSLGAAGAYGYSKTIISAGLFPRLFNSECSGWGTGVATG